MSDNDQVETVDDAPEGEAKGLRKQLEDAIAREKELKAVILDDAYKSLGLNPQTGLGKAIHKEYEGEASLEALATYAKEEYGYEPPAPPPQAHPQAGQIAQAQAAVDQVGRVAGTVEAPTEGDALAKAEAEGDYHTAMAIKGQQVADMMKSR